VTAIKRQLKAYFSEGSFNGASQETVI